MSEKTETLKKDLIDIAVSMGATVFSGATVTDAVLLKKPSDRVSRRKADMPAASELTKRRNM
jgi:hypothetical protein